MYKMKANQSQQSYIKNMTFNLKKKEKNNYICLSCYISLT